MCYFPKKVLNKRFLPTKKNGWKPPVCTDERFRYVEIECGYCFECRKKKRNQWRIRNFEQLRETPTAIYFTGTVSPERYDYIKNKYKLNSDNAIITKIHRLFLERIRKANGKSIKHWCVTEKGHTNTRRIHLHGLYYTDKLTKWELLKLLRSCWIDGYCYNGKYVNEKTINYISKYMTKKDIDNPDYTGKVLCSPGLGAAYAKRTAERYRWQADKTKEDYHCKNGQNVALPRYYKEKLFSEEQRQLLWLYREDSGIKFVGNFKITIQNEEDRDYYETLRKQHNETGIATHGDNLDEINEKKWIRHNERGEERWRRIEEAERKRYMKYKDAIELRKTILKYKLKSKERAQKKFDRDIDKYREFERLYQRDNLETAALCFRGVYTG